ncbi:GNAT family N-acetyltransferase [Pseudoduganella sp.]|uniref:GNAT family N-acetyltransferase n=1 Tax=Pseudoduganella sp. TaxID=1880898 RepID=UPI0035B1C729
MLTLQPASPADIPALWALRTRALRTQCAGHYAPAVLDAWAASPAPARYPELLQQGGGIKASLHGALAGYAILDQANNEVDAVFVDPQYGGQGIGKALLHALEQMAAQPGKLHLYASLSAVPFYRAAGYRAAQSTQYPHPSGVLLDCVHMVRQPS